MSKYSISISLFTQWPYMSEEHFYTYFDNFLLAYLTTLWAATVKIGSNDLTSDPMWVIGLYLVVIFSYIFMGEKRIQKS